MGLAYGSPFSASVSILQRGTIEAAEQQERLRYARDDAFGTMPDLLWRVETVSYAVGDEFGDWSSTDPRLELFGRPVYKRTPCGARLAGPNGRWVNLQPGAKQWASETPAEALEQFIRRRRGQIHILKRQLNRAERELGLAVT